MTETKKFEYTVDENHTLIAGAVSFAKLLSAACPVLVAQLREEAAQASSARLFATSVRILVEAQAVKLFASLGSEEAKRGYHNARLFLAVIGEELGWRYRNNELEPELHAGNRDSADWAKQQVEREDEAAAAQRSEVNSASDGIA